MDGMKIGSDWTIDVVSAEAKPLTLIWIAPGQFLMGSPPDEAGRSDSEGPFVATLSRGFWLGRYLVTQAQWMAVTGENPSHFRDAGPDHPVENVSWVDVMAFCDLLNRRYGGDLPPGYRFQPPSEVEWEYACRAGSQARYCYGDDTALLSAYAWHRENSAGITHPVGEKAPNAWGLYDVHGLVAEWCLDQKGEYPSAPAVDWIGEGDGAIRAMRSSTYGTALDSSGHRCACRPYMVPQEERPWFGFRLCVSASGR